MIKPSDFIFCIEEMPDWEDDTKTFPVAVINTKDCWQRTGFLTDHYTSNEYAVLQPILDNIGLVDLMESHYECTHSGKTGDEIRNALLAAGLEMDPAFCQWNSSLKEE